MPRDSHEHLPEPPSNANGSSEFTQIFGRMEASSSSGDTETKGTSAESGGQASADGGFTAMFSALQTDSIPAQALGQKAPPIEPNASEAPTQVFAAMPNLQASVHNTAATDETRIFTPTLTSLQPPTAVPEHQDATSLQQGSSSEFTNVFQPIAPPSRVAPPPVALNSAPASGEFTQFFSAISAREQAAKPAAPPHPITHSAAEIATSPSEHSTNFTPTFHSPPPSRAVIALVASPISAPQTQSQAGEFTQLFQQQALAQTPPVAKPPSSAPPAQFEHSPALPRAAEPSGFEQMFSQVRPASPPPPTVPSAQPSFGAPASDNGLTDIFAAHPAREPMRDPNLSDLFRAPAQPPAPSTAAASMAPSAVPKAYTSPTPGTPNPPPTAGEFTRLMQSLESPSSGAVQPVAQMPVDAAFFSSSASGNAGEGEYTRVLRGSGPALPSAAPGSQPSAGSAASPGMALAPAPKVEASKDGSAKEKPKTVVILLVVMNAILLLALLLIGFVLLHRR